MLCSGFNVVGFNWISSPAAAELESIVMDWMGKMLDLPSSFLFSGTGGGVIHGSISGGVVCTMAAARDIALKKLGGGENIVKLVVYGSDQTHFILQKAARLIGISDSNFRVITTSFSTRFALSPDNLRSAIEQDIKAALFPLYLCGTVGTTACAAIDPIKELGKIATQYKMWFHIDAAYGGCACICPEFRPHLDGVELANSISISPHKWLLTNLDCCCLWLKQPKILTDSLSITAEYLSNSASESDSESVVDYKDWQIALTRRFKALKLWVVIRKHGIRNLRQHIRSDVKLAEQFEGLVARDDRFEIVVPRRFALVCFRLKSEGSEVNKKLLAAVNSSGLAFMTHGVVGGVFYLRVSIGTTLTQQRHVNDLWKLVKEKARGLVLL